MSSDPKNRRGVCRYCGCTNKRPCVLEVIKGKVNLTCGWYDELQTVCNARSCVLRLTYDSYAERIANVAKLRARISPEIVVQLLTPAPPRGKHGH